MRRSALRSLRFWLFSLGALTAPAAAQEAYPGALCVPQRGGSVDSDEAGRVLNPSPAGAVLINCPIDPHQGQGALSALVYAYDQSPDSISCALSSRTREGKLIASSVAASGAQATGHQVLAFPPIPRGEYAILTCTLPPSDGRQRSGITAYRIAAAK